MSEVQLAKVLERVAELIAEKERIAGEAKRVNKELEEVESRAVELLALSGLENVRVAGKSWRLREAFYVSVPEENREKVLEIAQAECPEYVGVNTSQLKSYLMERRKASGGDGGLADGTPFAGLVKEYRETQLAHLTVG